jgi:prepilin-type N-terminal cleavage/methylation domain-containing protein
MSKGNLAKKLSLNFRGFTLIELLVVMSIIGTLSVFIGGILLSIYQSNQTVEAVNEIKQNSNYLHSQLEFAVKNAKAVLDNSDATEFSDAAGIVYPGDKLALKNRDETTTVFRLDSGKIERKNSGDASFTSLTDSSSIQVSGVTFEVPNKGSRPTVVRAKMTLTRSGMSLDFQTILLLRNY